jgi:hypothetical protein
VPSVFWGHDCHQGTHWLEWWAVRTSPDLVLGTSRWTASGLSRLFRGPVGVGEPVYLGQSRPYHRQGVWAPR